MRDCDEVGPACRAGGLHSKIFGFFISVASSMAHTEGMLKDDA